MGAGMSILAPSLITLMVLTYSAFFLKKLELITLTQSRQQFLLCIHSFSIAQDDYIKTMARTNLIVRASFWAQRSPIPSVAAAAKSLHQLSMRFQDLTHLSYLKNVLSNPHCTGQQRLALGISLPYQTRSRAFLARNPEGVVLLNPRSPLLTITHLRPLQAVQLTTKLESETSTNYKFQVQGLWNWNSPFGSLFAPSS
jgi:hypothetical protein